MYFLDRMRGIVGSDIYKTKSGFTYPLQKNREGKYKIQSGELIRVCMSSDFFLEEADPWRTEAWDMMRQRSDVKFFLLTKRPQRVRECEAYNVTFCFIETGTHFIKDGKHYHIPKKIVQSRMAYKSGMNYQGKPMEFKLTDGWGYPIPAENLYVSHYRQNCPTCGSKLICNGCSDCGRCKE
nr:hypothetical protein [Calorimonas adulescens]